MSSRIQEILDNFRRCKLIVVGDLILDHYAFGNVNRVSPEAPIQILDVEKEEYRLGGAANVANNLVTLGARAYVCGVVGDDRNADLFCQFAVDTGLGTAGIFRDAGRPTTTKTRLIAHAHHLLRTDRETRQPVSSEFSDKILAFVTAHIGECQGLVMSDYAKGVLSDTLCERLVAVAKAQGKKVFVGPKGKSWQRYRGADVISANRVETEMVTGISIKSEENISEAAHKLVSELNLDATVITLGAKGLFISSRHQGDAHIAAEAREVFDVAGAGDTVLTLLSLAASCGYPWKTAARLANTAAGIVVGKVGTATVTPRELETKFLEGPVSHLGKIKALPDLLLRLEWQRSQGRLVVFTNGCFDLLHPGHVRYLEYCKRRGDILVVGLNSDSSVHALKGGHRPIVPENDRAEMLSALSAVDYVTIFGELTPAVLIEKIRPDVLVKGSDWAQKGVVGKEVVESYDGVVELYPLEAGYSTSQLIDKIKQL
jgi:D-beta-D-heptose 7-phosphate kinase/D-beta-D-heptose 1-phosphate adenosyltransferase